MTPLIAFLNNDNLLTVENSARNAAAQDIFVTSSFKTQVGWMMWCRKGSSLLESRAG